MRAPDGTAWPMFDRLAAFETDECVEWPFGLNGSGYGQIRMPDENRPRLVHALACAQRHGPRPEGADCAHSCGNRACMNYRHLRWATRRENIADMLIHGTRRRNDAAAHKLSSDAVFEIRERCEAGDPQHVIAADFGVCQQLVSMINARKRWTYLPEQTDDLEAAS